MRPDMSKVIVERPRYKSWAGDKGYMKGVPLDELPERESMTKKYGWNAKELNENLAPLVRYLRSNVGRPWNKVHSEICNKIKLTSTVQRHVLQHLWDMVQTKTFVGNDGKVYYTDGGGTHLASEGYGGWVDRFYVNPKSGLLCEAKQRRRHKWGKDKDPEWRRKISDQQQCHLINGIWYLLDLVSLGDEIMFLDAAYSKGGPGSTDKYFRRTDLHDKYGAYLRCVRKKQLNKKEIKALGLR